MSGPPPVSFWVISIALLVWALGGASIYVSYFIEAPERFAATAETSANEQAYAEYLANIPAWAIASGIIAALTRLLGAIGLLARRAWALPCFVISIVPFMLTLYRGFILADAADVMSAAHIAVEFVFLALGILAIAFARASKSKGILK